MTGDMLSEPVTRIRWRWPHNGHGDVLSECGRFQVVVFSRGADRHYVGHDFGFDADAPDVSRPFASPDLAREWCEDRFRRVVVSPPDTPVLVPVPLATVETAAGDVFTLPERDAPLW